ncbi:MAG TPA: endo alpha-1,4 polygalactosaminidase [Micromonosporaceae bacterium]
MRPVPSVPPSRLSRRSTVAVLLLIALAFGTTACEDLSTRSAPTPEPWPSAQILTWQIQLTGELDLDTTADVFEFDAFTAPAEAVERLRARGKRLICYVNAGVYEESRPDAGRFPAATLGATAESDGRRWLDIRQWSALEPVLRDRLRLCRGKGFHAVDFDDVDGYTHVTGFPLTYDDQLRYNRRLATLARSLGLSPGLRDDLDQAVALEPDFDFAVNEECFVHGECARLSAFVEAGKPVFHVEYDLATDHFCPAALGLGFSSIRKSRQLDAWRIPCLP